MLLKRSVLVISALIFAAFFNLYLFVQGFWGHATKLPGLFSASNECEPDSPASQQAQKVNPNKMLFISCGGFLD